MAGCVHPNTHEREKFPDKGLTCLCFLRCFDWSSFAKRHDHKPRQGESSEQNRECSGSPHLDPEFHLISGEPVKTHLVRTGTEKSPGKQKSFIVSLLCFSFSTAPQVFLNSWHILWHFLPIQKQFSPSLERWTSPWLLSPWSEVFFLASALSRRLTEVCIRSIFYSQWWPADLRPGQRWVVLFISNL